MQLRHLATATGLAALGALAVSGPQASAQPQGPGLPPGGGFHAVIRPVDDATRATMIDVSWKPGCPSPSRTCASST